MMFQLPYIWNMEFVPGSPGKQMQLFIMTSIKMLHLTPPGLPCLRWLEGKVFSKLLPTMWDLIQQELPLTGTFPFKEIN